MKYRLLGNSALCVSELAFGTMSLGEDWGWGAPKERKLARWVYYNLISVRPIEGKYWPF